MHCYCFSSGQGHSSSGPRYCRWPFCCPQSSVTAAVWEMHPRRHDERGQAFGLLELYDVLHLFPEIGLKATPNFDLTIRNHSTATSVTDKVLSQACSEGHVVAGVFVQHPISVFLAFTPNGRMVVLDSHAHGSAGASVAVAISGVSAVVLPEYLAERHGRLKGAHFCLLCKDD